MSQTAGELVKQPDFVQHLQANVNKLSAEYEKLLSSRAETFVNRFARECLKQRESSIGQSLGLQRRANHGSSAESEDDVELFDAELVAPASNAASKSREYSSSPATSFNTEFEVRIVTKTQEIAPTPISRQLRSAETVTPSHSSKEYRSPREPLRPRSKQAPLEAPSEVLRPYLSIDQRERQARHLRNRYHGKTQSLPLQADHYDFITEEIQEISVFLRRAHIGYQPPSSDSPEAQLSRLMAGKSDADAILLSKLLVESVRDPGAKLGSKLLHYRGQSAIATFLRDAARGKLCDTKAPVTRSSRTNALTRHLNSRETSGLAPLPMQSGRPIFKIQAMSHLEDSLTPQTEWTDCCGDVSTLSWTGENSFVCGATAHSDHHNMQYNKPGNLTLGSLPLDELRAVPDHRIPRPFVGIGENRENALDAMRETQDPWLYTSVVSSSFSEYNGLAFTASFDKTVKVWKVADNGSSMALLGTWEHDNKVNFVVTSEKHDRVATAADDSDKAIRVYIPDENNIQQSPFDEYTGERAREREDQVKLLRRREPWSYFPATMAWGKCDSMENLLLVGYSPRSITNDDMDIPDDKRNTGELCLFDVMNPGKQIQIPSARSQNVFEVLWHPSQPCFLAATSPGNYDPITCTQIRVFSRSPGIDHHFIQIRTLDCSGLDINELTIMPNSLGTSFVTASCTDGNTYVYDTAQGDEAIHILNHGESLDNPLPDLPREVGDAGVKFASWGQSSDRFYTGSTDGKVKAWDVRAPVGKAFVRNVLEVAGGISGGAFSKDFSKLLIGDATGKVHLLRYDDSDLVELASSATLSPQSSGQARAATSTKKRPKPIIQYNDAVDTQEETASNLARAYLEEGQLVRYPDPRVGVVQGPNYANSPFFCLEAHERSEGALPLRAEFLIKQQFIALRPKPELQVERFPHIASSNTQRHAKNVQRDAALSQTGVELHWDYRYKKEQTPRFSRLF